MSYGNPPKIRELIQELRAAGCKPVSIKGSHQKWVAPNGKRFGLVVNHQNEHVSRGLLKSVYIAIGKVA